MEQETELGRFYLISLVLLGRIRKRNGFKTLMILECKILEAKQLLIGDF